MAPFDAGSPLRPELDEFLFAPLDEGKNEMRVSVLSALARLDIDPWQEAANLSGLPRRMATERLAALLARLPPSTQADAVTTAARLIALLPRRRGSESLSRNGFLDLGAMGDPQTVIYVILAAFMLAALFNTIHPSPSRTDHALPPISSKGATDGIR